jgi:para-nitrobenzyl esterase
VKGAKSAEPGLKDADRKVSEAMMKMWTNYAKTGNPSLEGLVTWPAYEKDTDQYLYITDPLQVKSGCSSISKK